MLLNKEFSALNFRALTAHPAAIFPRRLGAISTKDMYWKIVKNIVNDSCDVCMRLQARERIRASRSDQADAEAG